MPEFLKKAACNGRQPLHLASRRRISRPDLIARLLRERRVARFIVAPDGFGKTGLALEYADTVFSFEHVFWIDGKSPCFLRDLDRDVIASSLLEADSRPFLAVIEDVPTLDPERVELLSNALDRLLDRSCEVLVTCTPSRDAFARHRDRVKLVASDLLLTDEEIDAYRSPSQRCANPAEVVLRSCRVAGLVWAEGEERSSFLTVALREELPSDLVLPMLAMVTLREGSLEDVAAFGSFGPEQEALLAEHYPYLGIDRQLGRFAAAPFAVEDIASAFARKMGALAGRSLFADAGTLVARLGDALVARKDCERACDFVRSLAPRPVRAAWLAEHGSTLFDAGCLMAACEVHRSLAGETAGKGAQLFADEAARRAMLGDRAAACVAARRATRDRAAAAPVRMAGAIVLASCTDDEERERACALEASLLEAATSCGDVPGDEGWAVSAIVRERLAEGSCAEAARAWLDWHDQGARGRFVKQAAAEVLRFASGARCEGPEEERERFGSPDFDRLGAVVRRQVARSAGEGPLRLRDALAGIAYERACERGALSIPSLDAKTAFEVHQAEMRLFAQRTECERRERVLAERERAYVETHPDAFRGSRASKDPAAPSTPAPLLTVNLFGGLDVLVGDDRIDPANFRRQKVKALLALLVLHGGREFSRDKLVSMLWPESDIEPARKNFYGIWAMLRRALSTSPGTCPYLIRQQQGLRLDASLLRSDVAQLEDVCRTLLFEPPGYGGWAQVFSLINDRFSDDLLPSENDNEAIAALRVDYRDKLVDALVAASSRLVSAGQVQEGLWFARAALQRDRSREDAYIALMQAQLAASQRTAALETYFSCRRFLADELGIDPSLETVRLYRSIIETETDLE